MSDMDAVEFPECFNGFDYLLSNDSASLPILDPETVAFLEGNQIIPQKAAGTDMLQAPTSKTTNTSHKMVGENPIDDMEIDANVNPAILLSANPPQIPSSAHPNESAYEVSWNLADIQHNMETGLDPFGPDHLIVLPHSDPIFTQPSFGAQDLQDSRSGVQQVDLPTQAWFRGLDTAWMLYRREEAAILKDPVTGDQDYYLEAEAHSNHTEQQQQQLQQFEEQLLLQPLLQQPYQGPPVQQYQQQEYQEQQGYQQQEYQQQQSLEYSALLCPVSSPPRNPRTKGGLHGKCAGKGPRNKQLLRFLANINEIYPPLAIAPADWDCFRYMITGELKNTVSYTTEQIYRFLYNNPGTSQIKEDSTLILWIQRLPSDSNDRYGGSETSRCRFEECCGKAGLIGQGHIRVAFDELSSTRSNHNPMHNAGYVHLYCIEKLLDFPKICCDLKVQVDERHLPHEIPKHKGTNPMQLPDRDTRIEAKRWIKESEETNGHPLGYPHYTTPNRPFEGTLCSNLTEIMLRNESKVRKRQQAERGGARLSTICGHRGNLEIEAPARDMTRRTQKGTKRGVAELRGATAVEEQEEETDWEQTYDSQRKKQRRN
ncbi:hypothetical protein MMC19_007265 [Ptychographa xylographoides]|nr:hypothetical protein [Ptychographa xylographoides]